MVLESLDLNSNFMEGNIPTELGQLESMVALNLGTNFFGGPIPSELGRMVNLTSLDLQLNPMTGTVPSEVQALPLLTDLDISGTSIEPPTGGITDAPTPSGSNSTADAQT